METKIKYAVLFYSGKKGKITQPYNCPDFEDEAIPPLVLNSKQVTEGSVYTIAQQIDNWVLEFDKKEFMNENDIELIFNWEVVSIKDLSGKQLIVKDKKLTKFEMVELFLKVSDFPNEVKVNFMATYSVLEPTIKNLSFEKQIDVVMSGMDVAIKSALNVYKRLDDYSEALGKLKLSDYSKVEFGKTVYDNEKIDEDIEKLISDKYANEEIKNLG